MIDIRAMAVEDIDRILSLEARTPEAPHWDRAAFERFLVEPDTEDVRYAALVATHGRGLLGSLSRGKFLTSANLSRL